MKERRTLRSALRDDDVLLIERALRLAARSPEHLDADLDDLAADDLNDLREAVTDLLLSEGMSITATSVDENAVGRHL